MGLPTICDTGRRRPDRFIRAKGSTFPIAWSSAPLNVDVGEAAVLTFEDTTRGRSGSIAMEEVGASGAGANAEQRRILEAGSAARKQLARDLHDGAQPRLINLLIHLQITLEELPEDSPLAGTLNAAMAEAKLAIRDLRDLAAGGYPAALATDGLVPTVRALTARTVVPTTLHTRLNDRVSLEIARSAYLLIAEALTNVVKHAHATRADVRLEVDEDQLHVAISDDGVGGAQLGRGSGLMGMYDRVGALGGTLVVDSRRDGGTVVAARLPLYDDARIQATTRTDAFVAAEAVS